MEGVANGASSPPGFGVRFTSAIVGFSGATLATASWISGAIFGVYILAFYLGAAPAGDLGRWNRTLPRLYEPGDPFATLAIGAHLAVGAIVLLLGPIQLIGPLRRAWPSLHRWLGRLYVLAAGLAGAGGLGFILTQGTIGGAPMNLGFGLYGALMILAAVQTYRHARARRVAEHRRWAIRLFALAIGSWLYRMDYGFWLLIANGAGHAHGFTGWFDVLMAFFFYIPNLIVAELFLRARRTRAHPILSALGALVLVAATGFVSLGTYYFTLYYWGPGIIGAPPPAR
jgi:hypothetical protein